MFSYRKLIFNKQVSIKRNSIVEAITEVPLNIYFAYISFIYQLSTDGQDEAIKIMVIRILAKRIKKSTINRHM